MYDTTDVLNETSIEDSKNFGVSPIYCGDENINKYLDNKKLIS